MVWTDCDEHAGATPAGLQGTRAGEVSEEELSSRPDSLVPGIRLVAQLFPHILHLLPRVVERPRVVDNVVGGFGLLRFGQLRGHAALDFLARRVEVDLMPRSEASDALLFTAGDYDE